MSLLSGIGNFLGGLFGGGDSEEEKRRKQQQAQQQQANITLPNGQSPLAPRPEQNQNAPFRQPDSGINLVLPETLKKAVTNDPGDEIRRKLAQKEADAMPDAQKQAEQGENWFDRNFFQKGANADAAKVIARNRAISQYQNENGYNKDPIVLDYGKKTSDIAAENSRKSSAKLDQINKISDITDKVGEAAQWVPITGSLMNLGNLGVEKLQKAAGDTAGAQATKNTRNRVEFGMNQDQWDSLGDEQRGKYNLIRNAGYALTPLDFTGLGGLAKAEGAAVAKKAALQLAKEGAVDEATKVALKEVAKTELKKAAVSTAVGTGINLGAQQYLTGQVDPLEALKGGAMVGGTSLLVPEAPKKAGIKALDSAKVASDARTVATSVDAPEVAPGVKSANPNREVDALSASVQQAAKEADDARARAEAEAKNAPRAATPGEIDTPAVRNAVDGVSAPEGVVNTLEQTRTAANDGIQVPPDVQQARQAIANDLARTPDSAAEVGTALARSEGGISPEVAQAEPVVQPRAASPDLESPLAAQAAQAEYDAATGAVPVQPPVDGISPAVADAVPTPANAVDAPAIPQIPESALGNLEQAPAAPRTHDALVRQMGEEGKAYKGKYTDRDVLQLEDLKNSAHAAIANVPDDELLRSFATADPETMVTNPQSFAIARASLDRLYKMADDPLAQQQVSNILDAMSKFESRSGQNLRVVQEEFDNMPLPMKVRYIVKKIDAANAETKNYAALADDPAKATVVEANITGHLQASQNIAERVAALEGQLNNAADAIKNGEAPGVNVKDIAKQLKKERISLEANNGELVKYYSDLVPGSSKGKKVNDFARRMMLASFTGRVNDVLTTTANVANEAGNNLTQGLLAKAINLVKPGTVTEGWRGGGKLVKGIVSGAGKTAGEVGGTQYTDNLEGALRNNTEMRSQLQKTQGKVGRTIQAATEAATNLSEGVKDQKLYQLAVQEGQKAGLKGSDLKGYAEARAAVPTRQMLDAAETLHKEVNNLNENPITRTLNRVASGIEGKSAIGGFVKNQVMPFTSWLGGNIYNSVTDKNVVASTYKFGRDALRGDTEGAVRNLAKTINGAAQAYALGYALTQAGLITNQDAEGYNDGGAYFHVGDRYIPVGMLGFFAPNIILGNATYNGLNNNEGKNPAVAIAENIASNGIKALQLGNALGVESNLARSYDEATKPGGSAADGAAQFVAGGVGQFIPGAASDLNSVLNNFTGLNPTKEKADTKVVKDELTKEGKPSTARDSMRSTIAGLVNRIPFASQTLPRKAGVAADDPLDRITKGDRDTQTGKDNRATAKAKVDREKDFKARGIPNPEKDGFEKAVDARFENKEYDSAIEGLQAKLDKQKSNKDIPKSDLKDTEDKIKLMQLHKDGGYDPSVVDLYKKTSLAEWRAMGDPESDEYNLAKYQKLWEYDSARAKTGISKNTDAPDENAFSAKKPAKKKGGSGSSELSRIKSNTIGSAPTLGKVDFSGIKPQKAGSIKMPKLTQVKSGELIKKRAISVRKG